MSAFEQLEQTFQSQGPDAVFELLIRDAESTKARDEWIKQKMDTRKYKSSELYGRPSDPALQRELEEYIKSKQPPQKK